jgi:hypothetical protein
METPKAFVLRLPYDTPAEKVEKVTQWGAKNFLRFKVSSDYERDLVVAGGFFDPRNPPKSFANFRSLVIMNLKNWKVDRPRYERGYVAFVTPAQWEREVKTRQEKQQEARSLVEEIVAKAVRQVQKKSAERAAKISEAAARLQALLDRRVKIGFDRLAVEVQKRRDEVSKVRADKQRTFNTERFGLPDLVVSYAPEELDSCQTWREVKRRRLEHPQPTWKEREDEKLARTAREREIQKRGAALLS